MEKHNLSKNKKIYFEKLAHTMLEAEKSHSLPLAKWSPKKASGVTQYLSEGLRMGGTNGINSIPRAGEDDEGHPAQQKQEKEVNPAFLCLLFYLGLQGLHDANPDWGRESNLLSSPIQKLILSGNILTEPMFNPGTLRPVKLTYTINHHTSNVIKEETKLS